MLKRLSLFSNRLSSLPREINQLTNLTDLFLHFNPALALPAVVLGPTFPEIVGSDNKKNAARPKDILNFYFTQREGAAQGTLRPVNEVKLMLVGRAA